MTTVKSKIRAGTIFLFSLLLISGGIGIYYLVQLKNDAKAILANNYESVEYCQRLLSSIDSLAIDREKSIAAIKANVKAQDKNVTEPGEKELTASLAESLKIIDSPDYTTENILSIKNKIREIIRLNMAAIETKNKKAEATAEKALRYLTIIATVIFIIAITFSYNFPFIITNPIRKLTEAIRQIEEKNYKYRIQLEQKDEFGQMANAYNSMAARLEYFESSNLNKILFEKSRAEAVINSLQDASIGIDDKNRILFANDQALQLLGLQSGDIVGHSADDLKSENDLFRFLMEDKSQAPFKIVVSNRENYFNKEILDIRQKDGSGNKMIIIKNITSFKELDVAKTNFIATISHELKTPLASSDFGLKLLEDERIGTLSGEQLNIINHLKDDNKRMLKILSELLNMAQVESGKIEIRTETVDPAVIVSQAIDTIEKAAEETNIRIETINESNTTVKGDHEKLIWVLNNFLSNAVKFSPREGMILIRIKSDDKNLVMSVEDEGPGIEHGYINHIFTRYFKAPGNTQPGNGLGLAISKDFIEAMNGSIKAENKSGHGAVFSFRIPLAQGS